MVADVRGPATAAAVPSKYLVLLLRDLYEEINMKALDEDHIRPPVRPSVHNLLSDRTGHWIFT
jgi:hypothetical protein